MRRASRRSRRSILRRMAFLLWVPLLTLQMTVERSRQKLLVLLDWTQKTPLQPELGHRLRTGILDASRVPGIPATGHASVRPGGVSIHSEVEQSGGWISPL